jgi:hypothetical protein
LVRKPYGMFLKEEWNLYRQNWQTRVSDSSEIIIRIWVRQSWFIAGFPKANAGKLFQSKL